MYFDWQTDPKVNDVHDYFSDEEIVFWFREQETYVELSPFGSARKVLKLPYRADFWSWHFISLSYDYR